MNSRISEIKTRLAAATHRPWLKEPFSSSVETNDGQRVVTLDGCYYENDAHKAQELLGEFIVNAPQDIAFLLARVEKLEKALGDLSLEVSESINAIYRGFAENAEHDLREANEIARKALEDSP